MENEKLGSEILAFANQRLPDYVPGCPAFALKYGSLSFPEQRKFLAQAIREVQPILPRKGYHRGYACTGTVFQ